MTEPMRALPLRVPQPLYDRIKALADADPTGNTNVSDVARAALVTGLTELQIAAGVEFPIEAPGPLPHCENA